MPHRPAEKEQALVYLPHSCSNAPYDGARNGRCRLSEASSEEVEEAGSPIAIVLPTAERFSAMKDYGTGGLRQLADIVLFVSDRYTSSEQAHWSVDPKMIGSPLYHRAGTRRSVTVKCQNASRPRLCKLAACG